MKGGGSLKCRVAKIAKAGSRVPVSAINLGICGEDIDQSKQTSSSTSSLLRKAL